MADEYISREAALNAIEETDTMCDLTPDAYDRARRYIERIPAADVAPVRHGKWVSCGGGKRTCSECNHFAFRVVCNYCPNCGAKMDAE